MVKKKIGSDSGDNLRVKTISMDQTSLRDLNSTSLRDLNSMMQKI